MYKLLLCLGLILSANVNAASQINYLNVDGDVVHFSLAEAKSHTIPSCVAAETTARYAVLLTSEAGRAMYSLLITAMASKQAITVESANDCADVVGVERPKGVSIAPVVEEAASDKIQWVGYTAAIAANFRYGQAKSAILIATERCKAAFPNSRVMLWNDYINIINDYPHTYEAWLFDAVSGVSSGMSRDSHNYQTRELVVLKSGETLSADFSDARSTYSASNFRNNVSCSEWRHAGSTEYGLALTTYGTIQKMQCNSSKRIACVK